MSHRSSLTLFIIKKFTAYGGYDQGSNSLKVATQFIVDMLLLQGHRAALEEAVDQNGIEKLLAELQPATVILEALWVTPTKMAELRTMFPDVRIVVRVNSEIPFLASEGIGVQWIDAFMKLGVDIAFNSNQAQDDFAVLGPSTYLPNYYPMRKLRHTLAPASYLRVGCFGAMRPLKNQVEQAFAAVHWANRVGKPLHFHMNEAPPNQDSNAILKSVRAVIEGTGNTLILHPWLDHEAFLNLVASMDLCLQVSFSESFNLTAADAVSMGVPLVGSSAVRWLPERSQAETGSTRSIVEAIKLANGPGVVVNHVALELYVRRSVIIWDEFVEGCNVRT